MVDISEPVEKAENLPALQPIMANVPMVNGRLQPEDLEGLWRLSCILADSDIVPSDCKGKAGNVFGKLALGMEIGLSFTQSLTNVAVIEGKPSIYGDAGLALIHASGKLESIEEKFEGTFGHDDYKAICVMKRKGGSTFTNEFSVRDAKTIGKWNTPVGQYKTPGVWMKFPKRMLKWRARWPSMRDGFGDVLNGMSIVEELKDSVDLEETSPATWEKPVVSPSPEDLQAMQDAGKKLDEQPVPDTDRKLATEDGIIEQDPPTVVDAVPEVDELTSSFLEHIPPGKEDAMGIFVGKAAEMNGCPVKEVYADAMKDIGTFVSVFERWYSKQPEYASLPEFKEESPLDPGPSTETVVENVEPDITDMEDSEAMALMVAELYTEYGQKTSAEPLFCRFIDTIAGRTEQTRPQIYLLLMNDREEFFGKFESWQLTAEAEPGAIIPDHGPGAPPIQSPGVAPPPDDDKVVIPENFYRKWFSMGKADFDAYVWTNVKVFELARAKSPDAYLKAKGKWNRFYPGTTFPPETDASKPTSEPVTEGNDDLKKAVEDLWVQFPDLAQKAMDICKTVKIPPTDEGRNNFLETARKLYRGEIK